MTKDALTDYDPDPTNNTDLEGSSTLGSQLVSRFDNHLRTIMSHIAKLMNGTAPASDAMKIGYASDLSANIQFDCSGITTATTRTVTWPDTDVTLQSVGASDSPLFAAVELGHATDTTLGRTSAGVANIEGNDIAFTDETHGQHTFWIPAIDITPRVVNGPASGTLTTATNSMTYPYLAFDASTAEFAQFAIQMPKSWDGGTIIIQWVWTHPATTTNFAVRWGARARSMANDESLDQAITGAVEVTDVGGTTSDCYISDESAAMTPAGTLAGENLVNFEIYRNAPAGPDTLAVDAYLLGVKVHYTTNASTDD